MLEKLPDVIGQALSGVRAGLDQIAFNTLGLRQGLNAIVLSSLAFADHAPIPERYTADGEGLSPPLAWTGVPEGARSLLLLVEDADSPTPNPLVHAIVVGLAAADGALAEGAIASPDHEGSGLHTGRNSYLQAACRYELRPVCRPLPSLPSLAIAPSASAPSAAARPTTIACTSGFGVG
ncbi:MAG TPA: hypothetical protein VES36_05135, partial [Candidatus Limnocylindrales bacterium]|nr:hypothetical protein [Candidatus Limnocylindrales bacterium]